MLVRYAYHVYGVRDCEHYALASSIVSQFQYFAVRDQCAITADDLLRVPKQDLGFIVSPGRSLLHYLASG